MEFTMIITLPYVVKYALHRIVVSYSFTLSNSIKLFTEGDYRNYIPLSYMGKLALLLPISIPYHERRWEIRKWYFNPAYLNRQGLGGSTRLACNLNRSINYTISFTPLILC